MPENIAEKAGIGGSTPSLATIKLTVSIVCCTSLTYYILSSLRLYRQTPLLPRHRFLPKRGKSVTYVSGTICYLCVGSLRLAQPSLGQAKTLAIENPPTLKHGSFRAAALGYAVPFVVRARSRTPTSNYDKKYLEGL